MSEEKLNETQPVEEENKTEQSTDAGTELTTEAENQTEKKDDEIVEQEETPVEADAIEPLAEAAEETPVEADATEPVAEAVEETTVEAEATEPMAEAVEETPVEADVAEPVEEAVEETPVEADVAEPVEEAVEETLSEAVEDVPAVEVAEERAETLPQAEETHREEEKSDRPKRVATALKSPEEFDWSTVTKKQEVYSSSEKQRLEDIYDKTLNQINDQQVIDGSIVTMSPREVVVNIGYKSDGVIPMAELRYNPNLKIGDSIEVYVESQEDLSGQLILSHKKARVLRSWERVNQAMDNDEIINGHVKCRTKGGLIVDVFGIEAFLPGSQIDVKPIRDYDIFVGKTMEFKVVKINHEYKNVVVSHKALIQDEIEKQKADIISKLEKGQILEGTVKNITSYGVFIDLGGVDGLIHITDLSWGRINHPEEIVQLDEKINVVILDFDDTKKRIALGLKQLQAHPWDSLNKELEVGHKVKGKVVVLADYGAFIEIAPGVEGLIHVSEMSWSQHLRTAQDFLSVGDEVEAIILTLDREERKMSLGIKQLIPDPWAAISEKYPKDSRHDATVRNFTNFGIFVELEEGVDGLIHISDLSWSKKVKHPAEFTKIGEKIEVVVLDVDIENRRLSLGHKQLEENPWDVFETVFNLNSVHKGTIINIHDKGALVSLPYGVEGFAPFRHIVKEDGQSAKVDETLDFKVIEFSKENKKIILSHAKLHQEAAAASKDKEERKDKAKARTTSKVVKNIKDNMERTTLGDLGVLADLRDEMQESEKQKALELLEKSEAKKKAKKKADEVKAEEVKAEEVKAAEEKAAEATSDEHNTEEPKAEDVNETSDNKEEKE